MEKRRAKTWLALGLLLVAATVGVVGLLQLGRLVHRAASGADPGDAFKAVSDRPALEVPLVWRDDADLARPMEPTTREQIEAGYLRAWEQLELLSVGASPEDARTYFSGPALDDVLEVPVSNGDRLQQVDHELRLTFYSLDGSIVAFEDRARTARVPERGPVLELAERWQIVMLLRDGNWRLEQWRRVGAEVSTELDHPEARPVAPGLPRNGVNYYPQATPWAEMWTEWDAATVADDLDLAVDLGFDGVRVFLHFEALGGARPDPAVLSRVRELLDLAGERALGVTLTLFDGRSDHRPSTWSDDDAHLDAVHDALGAHPALAMWDLKNEPDRDMGREASAAEVRAWLVRMGRRLRSLQAEDSVQVPITIGWSTADAVQLVDHVDVVSFHDYGPADGLAGRLAEVREQAGDRPVALQEFGLPTWATVLPGGHTEAEQSHHLATALRVARSAGVSTHLWTLHDLDRPPPDAGSMPWRTGPQTHLGIIRPDGTPKPAAALFGPDADITAVPAPGLGDRLSKPFWRLVMGGAIAGLLAVAGGWGWRRRRS